MHPELKKVKQVNQVQLLKQRKAIIVATGSDDAIALTDIQVAGKNVC